jgi:predicted AAA+ superfamily ATPase
MVIRGARQVGKTWLVRDFAVRNQLELIELNMEKFPNRADLFSENDPKKIVKNIEAELSVRIEPELSCLFLDEIQATPELLSKLRWFKEDMPKLPVMAAGSLLEFALDKIQYSMPVGRITYAYLEPLSFFEFMLASGNEALYRKMLSLGPKEGMPRSLHEKGMTLYHQYCLVGGMPEPVAAWVEDEDLQACVKIQHDLLATFRDDFHKYGGEMDARLLNRILLSVSEQLGDKFVYSMVDSGVKIPVIKKALMMLFQARVCSRIAHTSGNGLPLGAESNDKFFKSLMVDVGLVSAQLGLSANKHSNLDKMILTNKGAIAEQFVGQQLRASYSPLFDSKLYYWQRTGGRLGEIDYIIQHGNNMIPIEIKSGAAGSMKSLHQFMAEKNLTFAVRFNANPPSVEDLNIKTTLGHPVEYRLLSLPLYLAENVGAMINQIEEG